VINSPLTFSLFISLNIYIDISLYCFRYKPTLYSKIMTQYDSDREPANGSKYSNFLFIYEISRTGCFRDMQEVDIQIKKVYMFINSI